MSRWKRPLTCKEVKKILRNPGFTHRNTQGSHENWIREEPGRRWKVTVDCPKQPFTDFLVKSMASQAGVSVRDFCTALDK